MKFGERREMKEIHCRKDSDAVKQYFESLDALQKAVDRLYAFVVRENKEGRGKSKSKSKSFAK